MAAADTSKFFIHACVFSAETEGSGEAEEHPAGAAYEGYVRGGKGADHGDTGVAGMPESHATPLGAGASDDGPDPLHALCKCMHSSIRPYLQHWSCMKI